MQLAMYTKLDFFMFFTLIFGDNFFIIDFNKIVGSSRTTTTIETVYLGARAYEKIGASCDITAYVPSNDHAHSRF